MKRRYFIKNLALTTVPFTFMPVQSIGSPGKSQDKRINEVLDYINKNWEKSIYKDAPGKGFNGIDLPYPYTSPSIKGEGQFTFFFYWDTYFTNLGLLRNKKEDQVKNNIKNILWLIDEQGYMPNHVGLYNRSQTPYFQLMVGDYFEKVKNEDEAFFKKCAEGVRKEYQFWMTARYSRTGLNHFGHHEDAEGCIEFYNGPLVSRLKLDRYIPDEEKIVIGGHGIAEAENWDFCQRYHGRAMDFNAVDLNALLWSYEQFLYTSSKKIGWYLSEFYLHRAEKRKALIDKFLWNEDSGWYFDYDFNNKKQSDIYSISGMQPLFMGLASEVQADKMVKNLDLFERDYGIATTAEHPGCRDYQWAYPVVWPPMVYLTVKGLDNYGYKNAAKRIADKFIDVNTNLFLRHGKLFEKTDAETGKLSNAEYGSAPMMGWTAGVYVALAEYLELVDN